MSKTRLFKYFDIVILILLALFFITEHHFKFTAVKNISLYLSFLLVFCLFLIDKKALFLNLKTNFNSAKPAFLAIIFFIIYVAVVSFFPYDPRFNSFKEAFSEFGRGSVFLIVILCWFDGSKDKIKFMFYSVILAFIFVTISYSKPLFFNFNDIDAETFESGRIISRAYADYVDRFLAFGLISMLFFRSNSIRFLSLILCIILPIIMDVLAGARGSYLAGFVCIVLFFIISYQNGFKEIYKKNLKYIVVFAAICFSAIFLILFDSSIAKYKLSQGSYSSGRDLILKERLPLLLNSPRAFVGLGYGKDQYDSFLRDENDKGVNISMMQIHKDSGERFWWNDEPFFVGKYYYYGVFGTSMLVFIVLWLVLVSYSKFKTTRNLMYLAIFLSVIAYFGVRGLFESINLRILYMFYMVGFVMMLNSYYKKDSDENFAYKKR